MSISELYKRKKPVISFEIFPPNERYPIERVYSTIDELAKLKPDYISVTYGAGGTTRGRTVEIASRIKNIHNIEALAHLTCIGATSAEIDRILQELKDKNLHNILALRGDNPLEGTLPEGDFQYAAELVARAKKKNTFTIGGAYYPEGHLENNDLLDLFHLKKKVDAGTDFLISQIFFDNNFYYDFREKTHKLGIDIPLIPGVIPVTDARQIKKITELCGCSIPPKFQKILDRYKDKPEALKEAGIAYAVEQIIDLLSSGTAGVHIYTMNKVEVTREIMRRIENIRESFEEVV